MSTLKKPFPAANRSSPTLIRKCSRALALSLAGIMCLAALLAATACSSSSVIVLPPAELTKYEPSVFFKQIWQMKDGQSSKTELTPFQLFLAADRLYYLSQKNSLAVLDTANGKRIATSDYQADFQAGVGGGDGTLLLATRQGELVAIEADTLQLRWKTLMSSEILSLPQIEDGVVVVRTNDGKIAALDSFTGAHLWSHDRPAPALTLRGTSAPLVINGAVFAGMDNGRLIAITLSNGQLGWETTVGIGRGRSEIERLIDIDSDPILIGNQLFAAAYQDRLVSLEPNSGQMIWERPMSTRLPLAADNSALYAVSTEDDIWAVTQASGSAVWRQEALKRRRLSPPLVVGSFVFVGDYQGYLHCLDTTTGELLGRVRAASKPIAARPVSAGDAVIIKAIDGTIAAFSIDF